MTYNNIRRMPSLMEKILASASYINPLIGFILIIITVLMKTNMKPFLKYHIFQSIFIAFALYVLFYGITLVMNLLSAIPIIKSIVSFVTFYLTINIILGISIITLLKSLFLLYLIIGVFRNSDSYVPWVSDIIKANLRG